MCVEEERGRGKKKKKRKGTTTGKKKEQEKKHYSSLYIYIYVVRLEHKNSVPITEKHNEALGEQLERSSDSPQKRGRKRRNGERRSTATALRGAGWARETWAVCLD